MSDNSLRWAIGLMSGTSMDGIDAALIRSDGVTQVETGAAVTMPYDEAFRAALRGVMGGRGEVAAVERDLTLRHAMVVEVLLKMAGLAPRDLAVVGFHGQTDLHAPAERRTRQIGDGALLAARSGIDVVADFRSQDVAAGGQGAPLAPLYQPPWRCAWSGHLRCSTWVASATSPGSARRRARSSPSTPARATP